jgi:hypothetical protein
MFASSWYHKISRQPQVAPQVIAAAIPIALDHKIITLHEPYRKPGFRKQKAAISKRMAALTGQPGQVGTQAAVSASAPTC